MKTKAVDGLKQDHDYEGSTEHCWRCGMKINKRPRWVRIIDGGAKILHPESETEYVPDSGDCGSFPLGPDCAKAIGIEWTIKN